MGANASKCSKIRHVEPASTTQRENMATWHRSDIPVTDVYDIVEVIGKGRMGEVYKVRRKVENRGLHNTVTRNKSFGLDNSEHSFKRSESLPPPRSEQILDDDKLLSPGSVPDSKPVPILRKASRGNLLKLDGNSQGSGIVGTMPDRDDSSNISVKHFVDDGSTENTPTNLRITPSKSTSFAFDSDESDSKEEDSMSVHTSTTDSPTKRRTKRVKSRLRFQRQYACKTVLTGGIKAKQLQKMMNEIYIMRSLDHPYIIRLYEVYQIKEKIWMVMDLCNGGDLTTRKLNESQVVVVAEQILRGVVYLHRNNVCHQDLKLENILYEHSGKDATIRLIDFGISEKYDQLGNKTRSDVVAYTMSPEISSGSGSYTSKSDMWAIGVIVWVLLAGDYPFMRTNADLKNKASREALNNADYDYGITWRGRNITQQAKRFVAGCLRKKPDSRWSAQMALAHLKETWVPGLEERESKLKHTKSSLSAESKELKINMDDIARFCESGLLKQTVLITMANTMDRSEVGELQNLFLLLDSEQTGTICMEELKEAFVQLGLPSIDDGDLRKIFAVIDHDNTGQIHYAEFLAALAESHGLVTTDRLSDAFDRIDQNGKGYISHDDLKAILGENYKEEVANKMIEEGDFKKNGKIDYDELLQLMYGEEDCDLVIGGEIVTT